MANAPEVRANRRVRVAMIGAGAMATFAHFPSLASFEDVALAAVCDIDPGRLHATADKFRIDDRYADYRRMVEEVGPDAVYVIGQPHLMFDIWVWCLQRGLHLFIEKPLGLTLHQARMLAHLAENHGCITQVDFQRRACPLLVQLRQECLKRGPIVHAVREFYKYAPQPRFDARDHMMDDCVHAIDTVRWLCGGEVVRVDSRCRRVGVPDLNFIAALLHFDTGATGVVLNSWSSGRRIFRVQIHAPGVWADAEVEGKGRLDAQGDCTGVEYDTREAAGSNEAYVFGGFRARSREFIDAIKDGSQPSSCFADALKTMEVAETLLAQAHLKGE